MAQIFQDASLEKHGTYENTSPAVVRTGHIQAVQGSIRDGSAQASTRSSDCEARSSNSVASPASAHETIHKRDTVLPSVGSWSGDSRYFCIDPAAKATSMQKKVLAYDPHHLQCDGVADAELPGSQDSSMAGGVARQSQAQLDDIGTIARWLNGIDPNSPHPAEKAPPLCATRAATSHEAQVRVDRQQHWLDHSKALHFTDARSWANETQPVASVHRGFFCASTNSDSSSIVSDITDSEVCVELDLQPGISDSTWRKNLSRESCTGAGHTDSFLSLLNDEFLFTAGNETGLGGDTVAGFVSRPETIGSVTQLGGCATTVRSEQAQPPGAQDYQNFPGKLLGAVTGLADHALLYDERVKVINPKVDEEEGGSHDAGRDTSPLTPLGPSVQIYRGSGQHSRTKTFGKMRCASYYDNDILGTRRSDP